MNQHMIQVRKLEGVKGVPRAVLIVLADHSDEKGRSFPSWKTIQRESGFERSAVASALQSLKRMGFISWTQRRDGYGDLTSNIYSLTIASGQRDGPPSPGDGPPSPGDGRGSPGDGPPSPPDGRGVVREMDEGSPGDGRRSNNEAPSESNKVSNKEATPLGDDGSEFGFDVEPITKPNSEKDALKAIALEIYESYPKKVKKKEALEAILEAMKEHHHGFLLAQTKAYADAIGWQERKWILDPPKWFKTERFNDDPAEWRKPEALKTGFNGIVENLKLRVL